MHTFPGDNRLSLTMTSPHSPSWRPTYWLSLTVTIVDKMIILTGYFLRHVVAALPTTKTLHLYVSHVRKNGYLYCRVWMAFETVKFCRLLPVWLNINLDVEFLSFPLNFHDERLWLWRMWICISFDYSAKCNVTILFNNSNVFLSRNVYLTSTEFVFNV